jgi:uncharacterized protein YdhG (YjbR/CyaY superfamily)
VKNMPAFATVDAYLAAATPAARGALQRIRRTIHAAAPDVEEGFSYGIPSFRLGGKTLMWFAAFKDHCSLFPTAAVIAQYTTQLERFDTAKGTIRFDPGKPPSAALIARLVKARVAMVRPESELRSKGRSKLRSKGRSKGRSKRRVKRRA